METQYQAQVLRLRPDLAIEQCLVDYLSFSWYKPRAVLHCELVHVED